MSIKFGTITNITDKEGYKKHEILIGRNISYDEDFVVKGRPAFLNWKDDNDEMKYCRTSTVQDIEEDSYGLTLYTRNSIFYIEK